MNLNDQPFSPVLEPGEEILWEGKPDARIFIKDELFVLGFWLFGMFTFIAFHYVNKGEISFLYAFAPEIYSCATLLYIIWRIFVCKQTVYAVTTKKAVVSYRSNRGFQTAALERIANIEEEPSAFIRHHSTITLTLNDGMEVQFIGVQSPSVAVSILREAIDKARSKSTRLKSKPSPGQVELPPEVPIPNELSKIIQPEERLLWADRPVTLPFLLSDGVLLPVSIIWFLIVVGATLSNGPHIPRALLIIDVFILIPLWISLFHIFYLDSIRDSIWHVITDKRVIVTKEDRVESIQLENLRLIDVTINMLQGYTDAGSIECIAMPEREQTLEKWDIHSIRKPYLFADILARLAFRMNATNLSFPYENQQTVLWTGKPLLLPSIVKPAMTIVLLLLIYTLIESGIYSGAAPSGIHDKGTVAIFLFFSMLLSLPIFYYIILMTNQITGYRNGRYVCNDGGIIISQAKNLTIVGYSKISRVDITINPVESLLGAGTVAVYTGRFKKVRKGNFLIDIEAPELLVGINDPHKVATLIRKQMSATHLS